MLRFRERDNYLEASLKLLKDEAKTPCRDDGKRERWAVNEYGAAPATKPQQPRSTGPSGGRGRDEQGAFQKRH